MQHDLLPVCTGYFSLVLLVYSLTFTFALCLGFPCLLDPSWVRPVIFNLFHLMALHELITKILWRTENIFLAGLTENGCNFDSFTLDSYCCVGFVIFYLTI